MVDVLSGFTTIWVVIGVGILVAHLGLFGEQAERMLNRLAFFIGMPTLMFMALSRADVARIFSTNVLVSAIGIVATAGIYLTVAWLRWHRGAGHKVIGAFCSCYVNANNMGLPIAAYVMKDTSWVAPILLIQQAVLQPIGLGVLDMIESRRGGRATSWLHNVTTPLRNPMTLGVLCGLAVNLTGIHVPQLAADTLDMLGGLAVPCMLIAFGISLRLGPLPGRTESAETIFVSVLKLFVQPLAGLAFAWLFGVDRATALAIVVMAGLPTAQNVFVFSSRYDTSTRFARDVIFITTICSIATITGLAALVHLIW